MSAPPIDPPAAAWSCRRRVLFRFACLYFLLYALPFPVANLWQLFTQVMADCKVDLAAPSWAWTAEVKAWLDAYGTGWERATTWLGAHVFGVEVIHQQTGSGDTAAAYVQFGASLFIAGLLTGLWSVTDPRAHHRRLGKWLHLGVRWYLGFTLLSYGLIKFYAGQFSYPGLGRLMNTIGDTSPMGLVWTFMGFSKPYEMLCGLGETVGGLLLLWRRTSLLGCLVAIPVLANVALLNWLYDVPVKLYSTHLLLFAIALLAPDCQRLWCVFVANRLAPPADLALTRVRWLRAAIVAFGTLWIGFHLYHAHDRNMQMLAQRATLVRPELYGVWEVEKMVRGGQEVVSGDVTRWQFLAIDFNDRAWIRTVTAQTRWLHFDEDLAAGTVAVAAMHGPEAPAERVTWTLERGEKTVPGPDPEPRTMADFSKQVDVVRPSLILRGPWEGAELEVHLLRKLFRLERGFHFVQEMPFNR